MNYMDRESSVCTSLSMRCSLGITDEAGNSRVQATFNCVLLPVLWASLVAQVVKNLHAMWETQVRFLGQEDLLKKEMATHSSILAWKIPWTEEPRGLQSLVSQRVGHD